MKLVTMAAIGALALTMSAAPALGAAPATTPAGGAPAAKAGKAYGTYCKAQSKKHVKGTKGTPFSQCVKAMAQLDKGTKTSPKKACAALSKKHVKGTKGTPFSQCVTAGAKLLGDKDAATAPSGTTPTAS